MKQSAGIGFSRRIPVVVCGICISAMLCCCRQVLSQDLSFSQFFANELYMNPAFAGTHDRPSVSLSFRDQWPGLESKFLSYGFQYDQPLDLVHGGLGVIVIHDALPGGVIKRTLAGAMYSYHLQASKEIFINAGLQVSMIHKRVDAGSLVFPDMIDPVLGILLPSAELVTDYSMSLVDFSAGLVGTYRDFFGGLALHHLARPNEAWTDSETVRIPRKLSLHAGYNIFLGGLRERPDITVLTPHLLVENQLRYWHLILGLSASRNPLLAGVRFRQDLGGGFDSFILLAGFSGPSWSVAYSYDLMVRRAGVSRPVSGAHEISLSAGFSYPEKRKRVRAIKYPGI